LSYCVSAVQSSTMVGAPSRVRYVTVDIWHSIRRSGRLQTRGQEWGVEGGGWRVGGCKGVEGGGLRVGGRGWGL
jgi:hypothetical protein